MKKKLLILFLAMLFLIPTITSVVHANGEPFDPPCTDYKPPWMRRNIAINYVLDNHPLGLTEPTTWILTINYYPSYYTWESGDWTVTVRLFGTQPVDVDYSNTDEGVLHWEGSVQRYCGAVEEWEFSFIEPEPPEDRPRTVIAYEGGLSQATLNQPHVLIKPDLDIVDHGGEPWIMHVRLYSGIQLDKTFDQSYQMFPENESFLIYVTPESINWFGWDHLIIFTARTVTGNYELTYSAWGSYHLT
jgi:hypothetical protein